VRGASAHVPQLDGLRGLAVLSVMVFHQTVMTPVTAFDREFTRLAGFMNCGVDLFFVLSGYLITGILFDSRGSLHYYRNFYARRSLRIIPLYYAVLFLAFVVVPLFPHPKLQKWGHIHGLGQLWYWLFLSNWSIALGPDGFRHGMVDLSWTLSIEEQFYLTWPLAVRSFDRRGLMRLCLGLVVVSLAVRLALVVYGATPIHVALLTPARLDALALGSWVALAARGGGLVRLIGPSRRVGLVAAAVALGMAVIPWTASGPGFPVLEVLYSTALAAAFASLLVLAVTGPPGSRLSRVLSSRVLMTFGAFSYALYLFHNPVQAAIRDTCFGPSRFPTLFGSPLPGQLMFYAVATVPALALAWLSWHLYEKHWLGLKRFFPSNAKANSQ
jgi:peptidoglycan/LPS O-acetylase OafA/YrhL